jgi:VWFA-related protein
MSRAMTAAPPLAALRYVAMLGVALAVLLVLAPAGARAEGEIAVAVVSIDDSDFPIVRVVLTADHLGRPVEAIDAEALRVSEGGAQAEVRTIERAIDASAQLALVLALDTSGSVEGATLAEAQVAAAALLGSLAGGDAAAVLAFSSDVRLVEPLTTDSAAAIEAIDGLRAAGNTALYAAVGRASEIAAAAEAPRRAVVLLTDGRDFGGVSGVTRSESLASAAEAPVVFYAIGVGESVDRAYLEELAAGSGGRAFFAEGAADVGAIYAAIEERLRSQFVLEITSAADAGARERSLAIELTTAEASGLVELSYASRRPPAPVPAPTTAPPPVATAAPPVATAATPPAVVAAGEESGASTLLVRAGLVAAVALLLAGLGLVTARRLRKTRFTDALPESERGEVERPERAGGALVIELPDGLVVAEVGAEPVTIGSSASCQVRLPPAADVAGEHARLWVRDGRPMLHHLARGHHTWIGERAIDWASLHDGDEVRIGPVSLRYQDRHVAAVPHE